MEQAPSCFGHAPGEPFLLKRGDSKADHIYLPHAHSPRKAKLTALAHSQSALAERGVPLSQLVGLGHTLPGDPPSVLRGPAFPHVVLKGAPVCQGEPGLGGGKGIHPRLLVFLLSVLGWISSSELSWSFRQNQCVLAPYYYACGAGGGRRGGPASSNSRMSPQYAVVKIVREKYLKTTAFETQEQFQAFLSELYVYLVDQMHVALNQAGRNPDVSGQLGWVTWDMASLWIQGLTPCLVKAGGGGDFCLQDRSRLVLSFAAVITCEPRATVGGKI